MSEFCEEVDGMNRVCPYCNNEVYQEVDDFHEEMEIEACDNCGKKFHTLDEITISHRSIPDCALNDAVCIRGDYNRCQVCDIWMNPDCDLKGEG